MKELDPKSYRLLKTLRRNSDWVDIADCREIRKLCDDKLVDDEHKVPESGDMPIPTGRYMINDSGIAFILNKKKENRRWWIPIIVSIFALLIAVAAFIVSISET